MQGIKNFLLLFPAYCLRFKYLWYYPGRWFITPYTLIDKLIPLQGVIVDIGCGEGMLANFLALRSPARRVIGFDLNEERVKVARRVADGRIPNVEFLVADALTHDLQDVEAVTMIDVLHHIPDLKEQESVIARVASRLGPGKLFVVREPGREDRFKARMAYWGDVHLLYPGDVILFRKKSEWKELFERAGFDVTVYNTNHLSPLSSYLFVCRRR